MFDCVLHQMVLVIMSVLALLGDNPMQSEFACHSGMQAKHFCRACWVKGKEKADLDDNNNDDNGENDGDDGDDGDGDDVNENNHPKSGRPKETFNAMKERIQLFMQVSVAKSLY